MHKEVLLTNRISAPLCVYFCHSRGLLYYSGNKERRLKVHIHLPTTAATAAAAAAAAVAVAVAAAAAAARVAAAVAAAAAAVVFQDYQQHRLGHAKGAKGEVGEALREVQEQQQHGGAGQQHHAAPPLPEGISEEDAESLLSPFGAYEADSPFHRDEQLLLQIARWRMAYQRFRVNLKHKH